MRLFELVVSRRLYHQESAATTTKCVRAAWVGVLIRQLRLPHVLHGMKLEVVRVGGLSRERHWWRFVLWSAEGLCQDAIGCEVAEGLCIELLSVLARLPVE